MFADETIIALATEQTSVDLDDETTILNLSSGVYFGLNEAGAFIWRLLAQPRRVGELRAALLAEYEVDAERCEQDLQALLDELVSHGLVEARHVQGA